MPYTGLTSIKKSTDTDNNYVISTDSTAKRINSIGINDDCTRLVVFYFDALAYKPQYAIKSSGSFGALTDITTGAITTTSYFGGLDKINDYGAMSNDGTRLVLARWGPGNVYTSKWNGTSYDGWVTIWTGSANIYTFINSSISETGDYLTFAIQNSYNSPQQSDIYSSYLTAGTYSTPAISVTITGTLYYYGQVSRDGKLLAMCTWNGAGAYTIKMGAWDNTNKIYTNFYNISTSTYTSNSIGFSPDNNVLCWYNSSNSFLNYSVYNASTGKFDTVSTINVYDTDGITPYIVTNSQVLIITRSGKLYNSPRFTSGNPTVYDVVFSRTPDPVTDVSFNLTQTKTVDINSTPTYSNPSTSNCILWLDAADTGNIDLSGTIVTRWKDKSGLNNHMMGNTTTPLNYVINGSVRINNLNTLDFTAANAFLGNTTISIPSTYTIFAVAYNKSTPGYSRLLSSYIDYSLFMGSLDNGYSTFLGNGVGTWNDASLNTPNGNTSVPALLGLTNGNTTTSLLPYYNGTQLNSKNGVTQPFNGLLIGRYFGGFTQLWNGYVGEILIYNTVLSTAARQQVEGYLSIKWGLYTQLPMSHPYYSPKYVGNLQVAINDANNTALNNLYYYYSINSTPPTSNSYVLNTGPTSSPYKFYVPVPTINNTIYIQAKNASGNTSNIANTSVIVYQQPRAPPIFDASMVIGGGNIQVIVGESFPAPMTNYYLNNISYVAYLYTGGTNQSSNLSYYTSNVGILSNTNTTYGNVISYISGISANTYTVYLAAKNDFGNSLSTTISKTIIVYAVPGNVTLSATTVAAGNLQVSIIDLSNTAVVNNVYYFYSTDGTTFSNSNILAGSGASPYNFYLNQTADVSYTIFVKASNSIGNSATANIKTLIYQLPRVPPIFSASLVGSGNLQITVGESFPAPTINNYYLNNVSYVAYLYTGGTNQSGNLSYYTSNVGILANTNTTYGNVVSYITGLSANTYTVYLAAKNTVGNTVYASTNLTVPVYAVPTAPVIDQANTYSSSSGNLTITFTDVLNDPTNGVSYSYYLYDATSSQYILL